MSEFKIKKQKQRDKKQTKSDKPQPFLKCVCVFPSHACSNLEPIMPRAISQEVRGHIT